MEYVDLRSDTVTRPTPAMREAMAQAEVGDDVYGEDPTVNRLQELAAEKLGKEAGLFVPSGTMGNLAAVLAHCNRGDEAILGDQAHTFWFEAGGMAALGGVTPYPIPNRPDGTLALEDVRRAIRGDDAHYPITRLIALENTHNRCGGAVPTVEYTRAVGELAREHGLRLHLDGARIFNAAVALGVEAKELAEPADSVTFCLSKGLSAPVGSVLCGSREFIYRAHRARKQLGGGMRQAGVLAAAGIVALEQMVDRLGEDHARARRLAEDLAALEGLTVDVQNVPTNMVYLGVSPNVRLAGTQIEDEMLKRGVKVLVRDPKRFRLVTHCWVDDEGVKRAAAAFREVLALG